MRNLIAILILLCGTLLCGTRAWASIAAGAHWNVRSDGNDANGGCFDPTVTSPGTDYSAQASAQVAFTDLVIGTTTTQLTSALNPFSSASVGNCINITGGTGFTAGWYEIVSVSGVTATMDRAVGTAASTGGTGNLGGGFLTLSNAATQAGSSNIVYLKKGTYTLTSTVAFTQTTIYIVGYNSTYTDTPSGSNRPLITTATSSTPLLSFKGAGLANIRFTNTAATQAVGIFTPTSGAGMLFADNLYGSGFGGTVDGGAFIDSSNSTNKYWNDIYATGIEATASGYGINASSSASVLQVTGSFFHGNVDDILFGNPSTLTLIDNVFAGSTGSYSVDAEGGVISGNTFYGAAGIAYQSRQGGDLICLTDNVFYQNNQAISGDAASANSVYCSSTNAYGDNTNANTGWFTLPSDIALTANPFVNASSGNFALNTTAGGGALLTGYGFPTVYGTTTANAANVGAVQGGAGGGGSTPGNYGWAR